MVFWCGKSLGKAISGLLFGWYPLEGDLIVIDLLSELVKAVVYMFCPSVHSTTLSKSDLAYVVCLNDY